MKLSAVVGIFGLMLTLAVACTTEAPTPTRPASVPATAILASTPHPTPTAIKVGPAPSATPQPTSTATPAPTATLTPVPTTPAPMPTLTPVPTAPAPTATIPPVLADNRTAAIEEREIKRVEALLASRVSQLPQSEQDCLSETARAGIGWPILAASEDYPVDLEIFFCVSDENMVFMTFTWLLEELLGFELFPESNECLLTSPMGSLIKQDYKTVSASSDDTDEDLLNHIFYFCMTGAELAMMGESIPAERLQAFKQATEAIGGLDALAETYTPAAKEILLDLMHEEEPAPPPPPAVTAPPPPSSIPNLAPPAPTPIP